MAEVLILDAEALNALAHPTRRGAAALRARAILMIAHELHASVQVPAPVLAEVCRGGARDAAINHVLAGKGIGVVDLTAPIARKAGALLARAKLDSSHAVGAFVVATVASLGSAVIATHDRKDISKLVAPNQASASGQSESAAILC